MNILIVGNGFDLSHYLPTKYDHFMVAMDAIENWDIKKGNMGFDDLFEKDYWHKDAETGEEWQNSFFQHTKAMYKTDEIEISIDQIKVLKEQLKDNVWYQYFSDHVREVKTWIDFETKINEALKVVEKFIVSLNLKLEESGIFSHEICFSGNKEERQIFLTREQCNVLEKLNILNSGYFIDQEDYDENGHYIVSIDIGDPDQGSLRFYINDQYIQQYSGYGKVNNDKLLNYLQENLEKFIGIFNLYLELIVSKLSFINPFSIENKDWVYPDKIYSFNYTDTFQRIHDSVDVEYLHGSHGEDQNIVLGVSDLDDDALKKLKAYGFTKYHQKLFKDTDYLFLDEYKNKILSNRQSQIDLYEQLKGENRSAYRNVLNNRIRNSETMLDLNFYIWGHSLDISDKDYIIDLFSLNDDMDRNVRVIIFYFDKQAKFSLLNNLLAILGKDKVEQWMKNKWLEFKPNPEVKFEVGANLEEAS